MGDWFEAERHVERAHEFYELGRWDDAETELRSALSLNPYQGEWYFNLGLTLEAAGRSAEAAEAFASCYELQPEDPATALLVATNLVRAGEAERALTWIDSAAADADNPDVDVQRIQALTTLGRHDEAEVAFYVAQERHPSHAELYASMADSLLDRSLHDKAVWCLREAAKLDPDLPRVEARLAEAYAATGRQERARQLYLRELRRDPGDIDTLLDLGELLTDMNRGDEAAEKFRRVLELEPDNAEAHAAIGRIAKDRGDLDHAVTAFDLALRLDPEDTAARDELSEALLQRGSPADRDRAAILLIERANEITADNVRASSGPSPRPDARAGRDADGGGSSKAGRDHASRLDEILHIVRLLLEARRPAVAVRLLTSDAASEPADGRHAHRVERRHLLALAFFESGQTDRGIAESRRTLELDPRFVPAMHNIAVAHLRRDEWVRARAWVRRALECAPHDPDVRRLRSAMNIRAAWHIARAGLRLARRAGRKAWELATRPRRDPA